MTGYDKRISDLAEEVATLKARAAIRDRSNSTRIEAIVKLVVRVRKLEAQVEALQAQVEELEERP